MRRSMPTPLRIAFFGRRRDEANQPAHGPQGGGGLSVVSPSGSLRRTRYLNVSR